MKKSPELTSAILFCVLIALQCLRGHVDDGFRFLFEIDKSDLVDQELTVSRSDLYFMSSGVWSILSIVTFGFFAARLLLTHFRKCRAPDAVSG
ncbi:MAG: hypothetical protein R3F11_06290 [Verrucomicrobiales bacterium]